MQRWTRLRDATALAGRGIRSFTLRGLLSSFPANFVDACGYSPASIHFLERVSPPRVAILLLQELLLTHAGDKPHHGWRHDDFFAFKRSFCVEDGPVVLAASAADECARNGDDEGISTMGHLDINMIKSMLSLLRLYRKSKA